MTLAALSMLVFGFLGYLAHGHEGFAVGAMVGLAAVLLVAELVEKDG